MIGRIVYAVLAGVVAMILCLILGSVSGLEPLSHYSGLIGFLVGVVVFFSGRSF